MRLLGTRPTVGRPRVEARQGRIAGVTLSEGGVGPPQTTESRVHTPGRSRGGQSVVVTLLVFRTERDHAV